MKSEQSASTGWSVVMTAWEGELQKWESVGAVAGEVLGRKGLDDFSLTMHEHLPAELTEGLPCGASA